MIEEAYDLLNHPYNRLMHNNPSSTSDRQIIIAALVLSLGGAVALGFGRFAYALLLEPMRNDLNWSYAQAGLIGSANAIGYLVGTMLVGLAVARWGAPLTVRIALVLTSLSLLLTGLLSLFPALLALRILTGLGGGLIYVGGATVVMNRSGTGGRPPLGLYYSGPGIGIAISGLAVPPLLATLQQDGWRSIWLGMGLIGLLALVLMEPFLRTAEAHARASGMVPGRARPVASDYGSIWPLMLSFFIYGIGYIGYMTFIIAFMQAQGAAPALVQWFWGGLGLAAMMGGALWVPVIGRLGPRYGQAIIMSMLTLAALLPLLAPQTWSYALSALLFGGSFLSIVTAVTSEIRRRLPPERWALVTGHAVALFALGQLIGPVLTGLIADLPGGLAYGMMLSAGALGLATLVALIKR